MGSGPTRGCQGADGSLEEGGRGIVVAEEQGGVAGGISDSVMAGEGKVE